MDDTEIPYRDPNASGTLDAQPGGAPPPAAPPAPVTTDDGPPSTQLIPQQDQQGTYTPQPVVLKPVRRGGLAGIVDEFRDAVAGTSTPQIMQDQNGDKYVGSKPLTGGQKWLKVAGSVVRGAAAGLANGVGPGGGARALQAGIQASDQQKQMQKKDLQDMTAEARQETLDKYNFVKLQHDLAAQNFAFTRMKVGATQQDIEFAQGQQKRQEELGSVDLGTYETPGAFAKVQAQDPSFWQNVYGANVVQVPEFGEDGERKGIHVYLQKPNMGSQMAPKGTQIRIFNDPSKGDPPKYTMVTPTVPMTNNEVTAYNSAAEKKMNDYLAAQQKLKDDESQAKLRDAQAKTETSKQAENYSAARKNDAEAKQLNTASDQATIHNNAQQLVHGQMDPANLSKRSKTYDATLAEANQISMQEFGVPFNPAKAAGDYKFATNTQTYNTLNYLNSLTGRDDKSGNLGLLVSMSDKLNRTDFPPLNAVDQWAKISAGNPQVAAYRSALVEVDDQIAKILQGGTGSTTSDAKMKQAADILNKNFTKDQIKAVAQDTLRPLLANRKKEMIGDNRYLMQWHGAQSVPQPTGQPGAPGAVAASASTQPPPVPANAAAPGPDMKLVWAPGMTEWRYIPTNQIKPNIPGQVVR